MTCSLTLIVTFAGLKSKSSMSTFALAANTDGATRIVTRLKIKAGANKLASLADFILELSFITIHVCGESQARSSAGQGFSSRKKGAARAMTKWECADRTIIAFDVVGPVLAQFCRRSPKLNVFKCECRRNDAQMCSGRSTGVL